MLIILFFLSTKCWVESTPNSTHLKYVYLGEVDTLPVIISRELTPHQEKKLIETLKVHKQAIRWTFDDIKGISLTLSMHRNVLEDGAKPSREP